MIGFRIENKELLSQRHQFYIGEDFTAGSKLLKDVVALRYEAAYGTLNVHDTRPPLLTSVFVI